MPEGAASLEAITPALVSALSWSIEIGSAHPAGRFAERRKPAGAGPSSAAPGVPTMPVVGYRPQRGDSASASM
jgi:hypothetical protein